MRAIVHRYAGLHPGPKNRVRFKNAFQMPSKDAPQTPAPPTPQAPPALPDPFGPEVQLARKQAQADAASRRGRSSTILTTASRATIGGGAMPGANYAASVLGG